MLPGLKHAKDTVKDNLAYISDEAKLARHQLGKGLGKNARYTRGQVRSLLGGLKQRIRANKDDLDTDKLKDHMKLQLSDWKNSARREAEQALKTGRVKSKRMVRKRSLMSLIVAIGIGAALGYLAAHQHNEAE